MAARKVFKGKTIVGIDILDEQNVNKTIKFLKSFLRYASPDPKIIGFHNYSDTNRFSTTRTKRVLQTFHGKVWLTETGGIVKLGTQLPVRARVARREGAGLHVHAGEVQLAHHSALRLPVQPGRRTRRPRSSTPA